MEALPVEEMFDEDYARTSTSIDPLQIQEEYVRTTADLYHWSGKLIEAATAAARLEAHTLLVLKHAKENGTDVVIGGLTFKGGKAITEEFIKAAYAADPEVVKATETYERIKSVVANIKFKGEMLVSLGTHLRQERDLTLNNKGSR